METEEYVERKIKEAPILAEKIKNFIPRRIYVRLKYYIDSFLSGNKNERLIILSGLRGVGKTTILLQLYNYLRNKNINKEDILYFSTDEVKSYLGKSISDIISTFVEKIHQTSLVELKKPKFIFIDEAHFDKNWSEAVKVVYDNTENIFIIVTGSSALLLEMSTDTVRRSKKEFLFPLNFSEYISLKYKIYPPKNTSKILKNLIFNGPEYLKNAKEFEKELNAKLLKLPTQTKKEIQNFLICGGFPFGLNRKIEDTLEKVFNTIDRTINKDLPIVYPYMTKTTNSIKRTLFFLAFKKPGELSIVKLANRLNISPNQVRQILEGLEKTQLIFSVKPYGEAGKIAKKPWKYYFATPTIPSAIKYEIGKLFDNDFLGKLIENLVASYFLRTKTTIGMPSGIFYDPRNGGVDFILYNFEKIIPVEVGIGKKDNTQIINAVNHYKSDYGIIISEKELSFDEKTNILSIPIKFFLFL